MLKLPSAAAVLHWRGTFSVVDNKLNNNWYEDLLGSSQFTLADFVIFFIICASLKQFESLDNTQGLAICST